MWPLGLLFNKLSNLQLGKLEFILSLHIFYLLFVNNLMIERRDIQSEFET